MISLVDLAPHVSACLGAVDYQTLHNLSHQLSNGTTLPRRSLTALQLHTLLSVKKPKSMLIHFVSLIKQPPSAYSCSERFCSNHASELVVVTQVLIGALPSTGAARFSISLYERMFTTWPLDELAP